MALAVFVALATTDGIAGKTNGANKYPNYYAARHALALGDCNAGASHLEAYLLNHSYIQKKHPDHYRAMKFAIARCKGKIKVRGVEDESSEIDPLPDHPPMVD